MKFLCKIFKHRNIFIEDKSNPETGKIICKRCKLVTGGIGKIIITEAKG